MNLNKIVFNEKVFLPVFVSLNILFFLPLASELYQPLSYLLMGWSVLILIYAIFIDQGSMKNRKVRILNLFVVSYLITIVLNLNHQGFKTIQTLLFIMISFYSVYNTHEKTEPRISSILYLHNIVITLLTVTAVIGLVMFALNASYQLPSGTPQGLFEQQLFGIYMSPRIGSMFSFITIVLLIVNIYLKREYDFKMSQPLLLTIVAILIHLIYLALTMTQGTEYAVMIFVLILTAFIFYNIFAKKIKMQFLALILSVVMALVMSVTTMVFLDTSQQVLMNLTTGKTEISIGQNLTATENTGIWKTYLKVYEQKPLFGFGNTTLLDKQKTPLVDDSKLTDADQEVLIQTQGDVHNGYIQMLVASGAFGTSLILIFYLLTLIRMFVIVGKNAKKNSHLHSIQRLILAFISAVLVNNVWESHLLFNNYDVINFFFWWFLGIFFTIDNQIKHDEISSRKGRDIAFVAWTPLHLVNIVNVKSSQFPEDRSHLYVYDEFDNAEVYFDLIKETGYFEQVHLVKHAEMGNALVRNLNVLINRNQFNVDIKTTVFDVMVAQGGNHFQKIFFGQQIHKNPNMELHYLEDGMITYVAENIDELFNTKPLKACVMNILNPFSIMNYPLECGYTYEPNLLMDKTMFKHVIRLLPLDGAGRTTMFELVNVFNLIDTEARDKYDHKTIFLDQPFVATNINVDEVDVFNLIKNVGEDILVKLHPRSEKQGKYPDVNIFNESIPWELLQLRFDFNNVNIISMSSTAPFTSVLMFEGTVTNVKVIFLIDVIIKEYPGRTPEMFARISEFAHKFATVYPNIVIPRDIYELKEMLRNQDENKM